MTRALRAGGGRTVKAGEGGMTDRLHGSEGTGEGTGDGLGEGDTESVAAPAIFRTDEEPMLPMDFVPVMR